MTDNRNHPGVADGERMSAYLHRRTKELGFPLPLQTCERLEREVTEYLFTLTQEGTPDVG